MARIRSIKPEFGHSEKLSVEHSEVHLLAALLLTYADDEGYFNANPKLIHAACCPLRELIVSIPEILVRLTEIGYIEPMHGSDGREYCRIVNFLTHQRVTHPTPSKIKPLVTPHEKIVSPPEVLGPELKGKGNGIEGEEIPEQQPPLNCARRLMELLSLVQTPGFLRTVEAAIVAEADYLGLPYVEAAEQIAKHAVGHRRKGLPLDKWYFEETKWRNGNGSAKRQVGAAVERDGENIGSLIEAAGNYVAKRTAGDGSERKGNAGGGPERRVSASAV